MDQAKLHFRTGEGQPFRSESRKCEMCGVMILPGMLNQPDFTEDREEWLQSNRKCT